MADILEQADEIRAGAEQTRRQFEEKRDLLKQKAENAWEDTIDLVKRHPAKALGIAAGAGFALGSLLVAFSKRHDESAVSRLRGLADTGVDAWDRVTSGFNDAVGTLKEAVDEAVGKFKS
jgi:hypothetical protein